MRRLILFRHAKAAARLAGQEDIDRTLTERGRSDAALMGRLGAQMGLAPDLVLLSPSRRTRETWQCAAPSLPGARVEEREGIYNAAVEDLEAELASVGDADTVMMIGHNPGLQELAVNLLLDSGASSADVERVAARFPTATLAAFLIDANGRATFDGVYYPRDAGDGHD